MTGPTVDYLNKARQALKEARAVAQIDLPEAAGRAAYLAAYHAAQAFIFARTSKIAKTHSGVRSEFARLAKNDRRIDRTFSAFLGRAYNLKSIADYAVGPHVGVSLAEAREAIDGATRFVDLVTTILADPQETDTE